MFEQLFTKPGTIGRYQAAPLVEPRERYLRHLAESGASRLTLRQIALDQVRLLHVLDLSEGGKVTVSRIEAIAPKWDRTRHHKLGHRRATSQKSTKRALSRATRWLRFLGWLDELEEERHPYGVEAGAFEEWMRTERGCSEEAISGKLGSVNEFFDWLATSGKPLASVRITDIDGAIAAKTARRNYSRVTIRIYAGNLRAFFRFAEEQGWCTPGLASGIMPRRFYPDEKVPPRLARVDIQRLLATTEGDRPADKRDRAILMLFIVYGLRAGEVRHLRLDDLDWENETLSVRCPKPGRTHFFPLSRGVGQAILRYILEVRPARPERTLFFTLTAPIKPFGRTALGKIVRDRLGELSIVDGRRGSHALRHAAAQHLLDQGMSMKVIGDYLGHRDPSSTAIYAKVNLNSLREVANFDLEGLA